MRWALTHATDQFHNWKLEQAEFTAELKYNKQAQSFRLSAGDKRLFFIEKTGLLQNKILLRTEYSVITGEILPVKNRYSGIVIFENKKYNYFLKDNLLVLSSKKENFSMAIEMNDVNTLEPFELYCLLFGSIRVLSRSYKVKEEPTFA